MGLSPFASLENVLFHGEVCHPGVQRREVVSHTAAETYGSSSRSRTVAGNDKVVLCSWRAVREFHLDRLVLLLLHRGHLLPKDIFNTFVTRGHVEEDLREVAAE